MFLIDVISNGYLFSAMTNLSDAASSLSLAFSDCLNNIKDYVLGQ